MKLKKITIIPEITNIVIRQLPPREDDVDVPCFAFKNDSDTLCINPDFKWRSNKTDYIRDNVFFWTVILTHEELHRVLAEMGYDKLDNLFPTIEKSAFFVNPDW